MPVNTRTRRSIGGFALAASLGAALAATPLAAHAQGTPNTPGGTASSPQATAGNSSRMEANNAPQPKVPGRGGSVVSEPLPTSVLLFPVTVTGGDGAAAADTPTTREVQGIVTDALRKYLTKGGVGVVVYNSRLPSIQRAVTEGSLKNEDAAKGPGDDTRRAQRLADAVGASEFITATVENYRFDPQSRRATFNLNVFRSDASGGPLGTAAQNAVGESPNDVSASRQEESAAARAAEVVAEQVVLGIYPQSAPLLRPTPKQQAERKRKRSNLGYIIPAAALGVFLLVPR